MNTKPGEFALISRSYPGGYHNNVGALVFVESADYAMTAVSHHRHWRCKLLTRLFTSTVELESGSIVGIPDAVLSPLPSKREVIKYDAKNRNSNGISE